MDSSSNASASRSNNNKKKGHKKTTNEQFIMLVREMDKFPDVMKGKPVFGANKIKLEGTWTRLVDKLNSIGPPHRTMSEWKKMNAEKRNKRQNCSQAVMDEARRLLALGKSKRSVAIALGMNEATLRKRLTRDVVATSLGRSPTFTPELERDLVKYLTTMDLMYNGLTLKEFMMLVFNFAEKNEIEHKFNAAKRMAGSSWVKAFLQRHSEFSQRKPIATETPRVMDINIPQVYSDLRGRINKRRVDTKSYLKESPRTSKRAASLTDAEYSGDPLVLQLSSPKREPNFEDSQEATSSHTEEEETPLFYPESPHFFAALGDTSCQPEQQQQLPESGVTKNSPSESQSFSLLQQQIQNQTMLLDILKNMTNNIGVLLERQTTATERQAAAAERQAAASEAIIRLLQGGDCSEIIEKLQNTSNK